MNQDLFKTLKELKQIQPDSDYSRQSRLLILNSKNEVDVLIKNPVSRSGWFSDILNNFYSVKLAFATGMALVLILIAGSVYYINNQLNQNNLVVKASEMNASIQVKLNEIKYLLENKPASLSNAITIQTLLEKATKELKEVSTLDLEGRDMAESLEKIKSAQEIFYQIDILLKAQN
jgi:membrane protein insertase Oxa1/YidC/SpoIIIJ